MKTFISIIAITVVFISALTAFEHNKPNASTDAAIKSLSSSVNSGLEQKIDALTKLLAAQQASNTQTINKLLLEQTTINTLVTDLAYQVQAIENDVTTNLKFVASNTDTQDKNPDVPTEADVGAKIDMSLSDSHWDSELTETLRSQTEASLSKAPGVNLDGMRCGGGVCRAKFISSTGKSPNIDELWGSPPLMNEGFTVQQDDGSLVLYFTDEGTSLAEIRESAKNPS